jgi:hypothetical protein
MLYLLLILIVIGIFLISDPGRTILKYFFNITFYIAIAVLCFLLVIVFDEQSSENKEAIVTGVLLYFFLPLIILHMVQNLIKFYFEQKERDSDFFVKELRSSIKITLKALSTYLKILIIILVPMLLLVLISFLDFYFSSIN